MNRHYTSRFTAFFVALLLMFTTAFSLGRAAEVRGLPCTVSFSDPSVTVGNNVTVNVWVSGQVGAATIRLVFDSRYLQYVSGDLGTYGKVSGNTVTLDKENAGSGNMSFSMTFKALQTGRTTIDCTSYDISDGTDDPQSMRPSTPPTPPRGTTTSALCPSAPAPCPPASPLAPPATAPRCPTPPPAWRCPPRLPMERPRWRCGATPD